MQVPSDLVSRHARISPAVAKQAVNGFSMSQYASAVQKALTLRLDLEQVATNYGVPAAALAGE